MLSVPPARTHVDSPEAIDRPASRIDFRPEAQAWLTVNAGTSSGIPARREICRPGFGPTPACRAHPKIVSWIRSGRIPARDNDPRATTAPKTVAGTDARPPPNFPMGVLTAPER